jgi:hypothetical protein
LSSGKKDLTQGDDEDDLAEDAKIDMDQMVDGGEVTNTNAQTKTHLVSLFIF